MPHETKTPYVRAQGGVHERVLEHFAALPKGRVLDVPTGEGALSEKLLAMGHEVVSGDIAPDYIVDGGEFIRINLDETLPFTDASFDYIACVEGVEHIENPYHLMREFARILRPGGVLVLSTPNILNIRSRLRFLFASHHKLFKGISPGWHLTPFTYRELKYAFERAGFTVEAISANRFRKKWRLIYPLLRAFIVWKTRQKHPLGKEITTREFLEGPVLIYRARLREDAPPNTGANQADR